MDRRQLSVLLAAPRGFCAGVDRAIQIVELSLEKFGAPVYVRHEIVHNRYVVEQLETKGAVFVDELDEVPDDGAPVVFSAHGVPKAIPAEAERRNLTYVDATCPLVSKVHHEAERHFAAGRQIILVGHNGHPEVVGTMGQLPVGSILLVESTQQAATVEPRDANNLAYLTQTTLSVDDAACIVDVLRRRFPRIAGPHRQDICYATTNRQEAIKAIAGRCDLILVIGSPNSSNSLRLVEVARTAGCPRSALVQRARDIDWSLFDGVERVGLTAGASAPETLVEEALGALAGAYELTVEEVVVRREDVRFNVPRELQD
ncbi:MAG: 4-hydroxy-3-methylbut-2-enyl diphosphate reductase [Alphaproteobacteria bacterium]|nr:4-hydroxy-3-methylbut-2-enyl diphosphate reductase [Alphaproteobacteria bacterium]